MINLKHLFTALLLLCSTIAFSENVVIDGIAYDLVAKAKQAKVVSSDNYEGDIVIPESVEHNGVTYSVTSIGYKAFANCGDLTSIDIPNSVTKIEDSAFKSCTRLINIKIPNSVISIGYRAFVDCCCLTEVTIGSGLTSIGDEAFKICTELTSVTMGNNVTTIGDGAFADCFSLTNIKIPESVTDIGDKAFSNCTGLKSIEIPNSVTSIKEKTFYRCTNLTSITIGCGVKEIDSQAFAQCSNLTDVYCLATRTPSTEADVFDESYPEYMTLHVPAEAINDYKTTAPWSFFGNIVKIENANNINAVPNTTTFITSKGGSITIQSPLEHETVEVYTIDGAFVDANTINNGTTTIQLGIPPSTIIIIKIGAKSIKTIMR